MTSAQSAIASLVAEGHAQLRAGRVHEAEQTYRRALALDPGHSEALAFLGMMAGQAGHLEDAVKLFERALKRAPRNADIHHNLGETWRHLGDNAKALRCFEQAAACNPDHIEAYRNGANVAFVLANQCEATRRWAEAVKFKHMAVHLLIAAGQRLRDAGKHAEAISATRRATEIDPNDADAWAQYGETLLTASPSGAVSALQRAIELAPRKAYAHILLYTALLPLYRPDEAQAARKAAHAVDPSCGETWPQLDIEAFLLYVPGDHARLFATHRAWGDALIARQATRRVPFKNDRDPNRRLRIGYVSPDLRTHSVAAFLEPLLRAHDREKIDAIGYSTVRAVTEDETTTRLKALTSLWRTVPPAVDDEAFRRQVRADRVDILVDLAGHTRNSRIAAFAVKPAPVTATWLGYPATTGLTTVDWRITDAIADPPGAEAFHTEKLMRLDGGFLCYGPPAAAPDVVPPPALATGGVTFGSFNNQMKLNAAVIETWSQLLKSVPDARLLIKSEQLEDEGVAARLRSGFAAAGVDPGRIELRSWLAETRGHLAAYGDIDIALDPFPYNGTTTTCEALWMGVPVITLIGDRHSARVGFDLLTRVGLEHFAAPDIDGYIRIAADLARDPGALTALRHGLRARVARSPLCDAARFAGEFESALRSAWRQWCESNA